MFWRSKKPKLAKNNVYHKKIYIQVGKQEIRFNGQINPNFHKGKDSFDPKITLHTSNQISAIT